jgi:hypothetical protein
VTAGDSTGPQYVLVGIERGQDHDLRRPRPGADGFRCGQPVDLGHPDVHQHHVGGQPIDQRLYAAAVAGLPNHPDVVRAAEHHHQSGPQERIVVHDQDPDHRLLGRLGCSHGGHGNQAASRKSPSTVRPCSSRPSTSAARSVSPINP